MVLRILIIVMFFFCYPVIVYGNTTGVVAVFPYEIAVGEELTGIRATFHNLLVARMNAQEFVLTPQDNIATLLEARNVETIDVKTLQGLLPSLQADFAVYGKLQQEGAGFILKTLLVPKMGSAQEFSVTELSFLEMNTAIDALVSQIRSIVYKGRTLSAILVRGNKYIGTDAILSRLPISVGEIPSAKAIDESIKTLWGLGYFSDIKVEENKTESGIQLVFSVVERPRITAIELVGNKEVSSKDIRELLITKIGDVINEQALAEEKQKLIAEYRKKGYYHATITQDIILDKENPNKATLRVICEEGPKLYIHEVLILGTKTIKPSVLKKNLAVQKRTLLSLITGTGVLQEEFLERDTTVLLSELLNRGYFDAKVFPPKVRMTEEGITIEFTVEEGPRYKIGEVDFKGDLLFPIKTLEKFSDIKNLKKKNEYFNFSTMQEDAQRIAQSYGQYGFAFADVVPITKIDRENHRVSIVYSVSRGEKVYIRKTILEGNTKTRDNVILRDLFLSDGVVYNSKLLQISKDKLSRTGFFSAVDAEIIPTDSPSEVDLKITVKEQSTGSFNFGIGFSTYSKFGISASLSERNLFGKGYQGSLSVSFSSKKSLYALSFTNPRIYDTKLGVGFDLYNISDEYPDFTKNSTGGRLRMSYPLGFYTTLYGGYRLEYYTISDVDRYASSIVRNNIGSQWGSTIDLQIVRNTTNSYSFPSRGTINSIGFEYGGKLLGGDNNFIKLMLEHQFFVKIIEPEYVVHFKAYGTTIFENGSGKPIPAFERIFIGGIDSVRGYTITDMSPHDGTGEAIGGVYSWYANLEFVWLALPEFGLGIVPFYDIGMNFDPKFKGALATADFIKQSVGLEIRWQSPLGLLRLAYGYPLNKSTRNEKLDGRFEFSIGSFF